MSALDRRRVWSGVVESGGERRGFDDLHERGFVACFAGMRFPEDRELEARACLLGVSNYSAWLAQSLVMDPAEGEGVEDLLADVREIRCLLDDLYGSLEALRVDLAGGGGT